jgi:hypothetical protein
MGKHTTQEALSIRALPGTHTWQVVGQLFGQATVVFQGDLFACLRFRNQEDV